MRRSTTLAVATIAMTTIAVLVDGGGAGTPAVASELETFPDCTTLRDRLAADALEHVGPYGLEGTPMPMPFMEVDDSPAGSDGDESAGSTGAGAPVGGDAARSNDRAVPAEAAEGFTSETGTNVQVVGVDEPDQVKLSGDLLALLSDQATIRLLDVSGTTPTPVGAISTADELHPFTMLAAGDRLVLFGSPAGELHPAGTAPGTDDIASDAIMPFQPQATTVAVYDVSRPATPSLVESMRVDGAFSSARLTGGRVLLVTTGAPSIPFVYPSGGPDSEARAEQANRDAVRNATTGQWIAGVTFEDGTRRPVADCDRVGVPTDIGTWQHVSIAAFDPAGPLTGVVGAATFGAGDTVYASADRVYVAGHHWDPEATEPSLAVHAFDTADAPGYLASGEVPGTLLNQFAMDRYEGHLRIATTTRTPAGDTDSRVTVLAERDERLAEVGRVTGLGRPGETIRGIRYLGPVGYVVTFEQTDPLYTIDLRDPSAPRVRGELKIPGYSAYLHPTAEGQLLGVGSAADPDGRITGLQMSVFDVSDLDAPTRTDVLEMAGSSTPAEWDHHAFTWVGDVALAVVPFETYGPEVGPAAPGDTTEPAAPDERIAPRYRTGLLLVSVRDGSFADVATVAAPQGDDGWHPGFQRTVVHDGTLLAVGPRAVWRIGFDGEVLAERSLP